MSRETLRKRKERIELARDIEDHGIQMAPCSHCSREGRRCIFLEERSLRCAECVRRKRNCNARADEWEKNVPSESQRMAIDTQIRSLEAEKAEAMAKVLRLQKQEDFLRKRKLEMTRRGLRYLEELDAAEEKERLEAEKQTASENPTTPQAAFAAFLESNPKYGPDAFFLGSPVPPDAALSPSLWADLGFDDGIPPTTQGS